MSSSSSKKLHSLVENLFTNGFWLEVSANEIIMDTMRLNPFYFAPVILFHFCIAAQEWPNWRGPNYNGSSDSTGGLPVHFDAEKMLNGSLIYPVHQRLHLLFTEIMYSFLLFKLQINYLVKENY